MIFLGIKALDFGVSQKQLLEMEGVRRNDPLGGKSPETGYQQSK